VPDLSRILEGFKPSGITEIYSRAVRLKEQGRDIIDLSVGEPDFETPEHVKQAANRAIERGDTRYTSVDGTTAMKAAVCAKFERQNGLSFGVDQILAGAGVKPLLFHAMQALLDPGDEVIVPAPCWPSYTGMVALTGATSVLVSCPQGNGFKLEPDALERAIGENTKLLILNSPGNPTGAVYDAPQLQAIGDVLLRHPDVWILSDDIYEHILFDGRGFYTISQVAPRLGERTLIFNGVSKGYAMTGWRIGYAAGPEPLVSAIRKIMSQNTGNPSSISQAAAVAALEGSQDFLAERAAVLQSRRDLLIEALGEIPGFSFSKPQGAFYLLVNCGEYLGNDARASNRLETSADFARFLLDEAGVATVPGSAFECDPYLRISYASSSEVLTEACRRIGAACANLR
jgi:aspartate aminotransferase